MTETLTYNDLPEAVTVIIAALQRIESQMQIAKEPEPEPEELLTIDQAAAFLHLAKPTVYFKVESGRLPYLKRGKRVLFLKADLMNHMKESRRGTRAELNEDVVSFNEAR